MEPSGDQMAGRTILWSLLTSSSGCTTTGRGRFLLYERMKLAGSWSGVLNYTVTPLPNCKKKRAGVWTVALVNDTVVELWLTNLTGKHNHIVFTEDSTLETTWMNWDWRTSKRCRPTVLIWSKSRTNHFIGIIAQLIWMKLMLVSKQRVDPSRKKVWQEMWTSKSSNYRKISDFQGFRAGFPGSCHFPSNC